MNLLQAGEAAPQPQSGDASYAPKIHVDDARVNWDEPAIAIDRSIRAHTPGPGAWTMKGEQRLKIGPVTPVTEDDALDPETSLAPGEMKITKHAVFVGTATQPVQLGEVQPQGKKRMPAADWARGLDDQEAKENLQ